MKKKISKINKQFIKFILFLTLILVIASCTTKFQKVMKGSDYNLKLETAIQYYQKQNYYRALELLEELISLLRGTDKAEKVYYYYAYCHYGQGDYMMASFHFKNYYTTFPRGEKAIECQYMSAYCKYLDSPDYGLDQTETNEAMKELQLFITRYPKNDSVKKCNELIDILRGKLKIKAYKQAMLYYNINDFRAAIRTFNNVLKDFPDIENKEEIHFFILKSYYNFAAKSVPEKKKERLQDALKSCNEFLLAYPTSKFLKEVNLIFKNTSKEISKFANSNT